MPSASDALGAHLAVTRAATRAALGDRRPANAGVTKGHQVGDLVRDPVSGQAARVIHVTTAQVHVDDPEPQTR